MINKFKKILDDRTKRKDPIKYWEKLGVKFGENVYLSPSVFFDSEPYLVEIGNNCSITSGVRFVTHDGGVHVFRVLSSKYEDIDLFKGKIIIGDNTFIGNNVTILPGVTIGSNCIIGYGSIVSKNVPNNSVACGIPARVLETIDEYYRKNEDHIFKTHKMSSKDKRDYLKEIFKAPKSSD